VLNCKEVELILLVEGSSISSDYNLSHDLHDFRMEKSIALKGFDSFRSLITLCDLDICESNGEDLTAMLTAKVENPANIKLEIGTPGLRVEIRFANQKVGYARIEDVCLQHSQVFHRRLQWKLEPFLNKDLISAFISRCLFERDKVLITLRIPVHFIICDHPVTLDLLVVPVHIKGIGFQLIKEVRSYLPLTKLFSRNFPFKFSIRNPISAEIQIRTINFVALQFGHLFLAEHNIENFVLTSKGESWSPKIMSNLKFLGEDTHSTAVTSDEEDDIFVLSANLNITIRTPGANRGLDIQNLSFQLREFQIPYKISFSL